MEVAFQGELGAYSEIAVYSFFGNSVKVRPCKSFSKVFESVDKKETNFGVIPIENSLEGSVNQNYDLFLVHNLKVCGEIIIKIEHCLIANQNTNFNSIKVIYSHPQALGQCKTFLEDLDIDLLSTYDTAGSVKMIKEKNLIDSAAIASERAAKLYKMKILARDIADNPFNFTRFFVISKTDSPPAGKDKTSIILSGENVPGLLYGILGEFAERNINLTKIESRPTKQTPWEYYFYLDFEGHRTEKKCAEALMILQKRLGFVKLLGSYPNSK